MVLSKRKYLFRVVQKAEIKKGKKYLVLKRSPRAQIYPRCWDFAGGKLEQGENPKEGIKREVKEEVGLDIEPLKPKFIFTEKLENYHAVFIVWGCRLLDGKVRLSQEHTEQKWVTEKELLARRTEKFLKAYFKQKSQAKNRKYSRPETTQGKAKVTSVTRMNTETKQEMK